ncbi:MAG TPA: glycosyl hydrolase family 28-related protein [Streptosporangiaceae bacterium]|nr:glycosyl hydrolase family 28-related protein [Streptosporangiaceae bacterium]
MSAQKSTAAENRPRPARRALLTSGAAGLAAAAGATLGGARPARAVTQVLATGATSWVDVQTYGADPTNTSDSTSAFQSALNAVASAGGGVLYIPVGEYKITSTLTWTSGKSLMIIGDGEDASMINRASATAPFRTFDIQNSGGVTVQNLNILNTVSPVNFTDDQVGLYFGSCTRVRLENVHINSSTNRVNVAVKLNDCNTTSIIGCDLRGYVNALYISGGSAVIDCVASAFFTNSGSGVTNSGNVSMIATAGTLHLTNCETNGGDHGLVLNGSTGTDAFVFINDLEINNCMGHAVVLDYGSQFWANQLWCSNQTVANTAGAYNGINVGSGYTGWMVIDNSTFQHYSGTGITIQGGKSYWITNSSFSGCCGHAANIYYDIFLSGCSDIVISGCHFDIEPFNSMNTPNAAVCVSTGVSNVIITASQFATSGYHTGPLINNGTNVVTSANLGA